MAYLYKYYAGFLWVLFFYFILPNASYSQFKDEFIVDTWKVENGLPQHTVNDIAQTSDGFIWIGTEGGLARFDGFSFKVFNRNLSPVLNSNRITALAADSNNRLYIGNRDGGLGYYENGQFYVIDLGSKYDDMSISSIKVSSNNEVFATSKSFGLIRYKDGVIHSYEMSDDEKHSIRNLVKTDDGLFLLFNKKIEKLTADGRSLFYSGNTTDILLNLHYIKEQERYIILSKDVLLSKTRDKETIIDRYDLKEITFARNPLALFMEHYLLYMINGSVYLYDIRTNTIIKDHGLFENIRDLWISLVFKDNDGNHWLGSESSGLLRVRLNPFRIFPSDNSASKILSELSWNTTNALAIYQTTKGTIYLTYLNSTNRRVNANGEIEVLPQYAIRTNTIYSYLEDASENLYFGSLGKGLYLLDRNTPKILPFPDDITRWIYAIYQDTSGSILVGTRGGGLFQVQGDALEFVKNAPESLKTANISYITEIGGTLWVSSDESIYSRTGDTWTDWSKKISISRDFFRGIVPFDDNYLVFGTYGNGLLFLNPKTMETRRLNDNNGLNDNVASFLHVDTYGNLWSTGNIGLTLVSDDELKKFLYGNSTSVLTTTYNKSHGAPTDEYQGGYLNSGLVLPDGTLLLPSISGFVNADIKALISAKAPDRVFLDKIKYGTEEYSYIDDVVVDYGETKLEIKYTAPFFSSNIKPIYLYKLDGFDKDWIEGNELQMATYANLPPGNYVFRVKVGLRDGKWSSNETSINLLIRPPFYMAVWFRLITLLLVIYLIYLIIRLSNNKWIQIQQRRFLMILDAQEQERKRIAADLHDGVGQLLSAIKLRLDYANKNLSSNNQEISEVIVESRSLLDNIADEIRTISFNLIPSSLKKFGLVKAMDETIQKTSFGHDLVIKFIPMTQKDRYDENTELTLFRIFQELLFNATKHANAKEIDIQIIEHQKEIILMFEDDGSGFDYEQALKESSGRGLSNIISRVHILGGSVNFDSNTDNGTTITVTIPNQ
jgi:signal transduction histidine kinase